MRSSVSGSRFSVHIAAACLLPAALNAQVDLHLGGWTAPFDGWDYVYTADDGQDVDGEFAVPPGGSLDGTWTHNNGSDVWDGSGPGDQFRPDGFTPHAPGGAGIATYPGQGEGAQDASVLAIVDAATTGDNRKVFFCHDAAQDFRADPLLVPGTALRDGLTLIARVRQVPDQDPGLPGHQLPDGGVDDDAAQGAAPGYSLRDGGKGGIGFYASGLDRMFTFTPSGTRGFQFPPQVAEGLPPATFLDVGDNTRFQALWITIDDADLNDRYTVTVYRNGSLVPAATFTDIMLGDDTDCDGISHLHMGLHSSPQKGSLELDYFGYKLGLYEPFALCPGGFAATLDADTGKVSGSWSPGADATGFRINRDGATLLDNLPASATSFEDPAPPRPAATYELVGLKDGAPRPGCDFPKVTVATVVCPEESLRCVPDRAKGEVALSWTPARFLTVNGYQVLRDGVLVGTAAAGETGFIDRAAPVGEHTYELAVDSAPAGACPNRSCLARLLAPGSPDVSGDVWDHVDLGGDLQLVITRDGVKTLYFPPNASADPDDHATLALSVTALPGGASRAEFPVELVARYDSGLRIQNLLGEDPAPFVAFSLSRTGVSQAADSNGALEQVAQVPNPPDPGTESISSEIVSTREAVLPLVLGRNILRLDAVNVAGVPDDGTQLLSLRIGPFAEGLAASVVPNPCPGGLRVMRGTDGKNALSWRSAQPHSYSIRRNGVEVGSLPMGDATAFVDPDAGPGFHDYEVEATDDPGCPVLARNGGGGMPDAGGFIREWLVFGPLDWRCTAACDAPAPQVIRRDFLSGTVNGQPVTQTGIQPAPGMEVEVSNATATGIRAAARAELNPGRPAKGTWFAYQAPAPAIDVNAVFGGDPGNNYVTHAVAYVENLTGADLPVEAHLSSDDSVELLVGATSVYVRSIARPVESPLGLGDVVPGIVLPPGMTRLMVKVFEGGGGTGFWLRFEKDFFPVVDELRVHLAPSLLLPPAAPTSLSAQAGDRQVALDWPDSPEPGLLGYNVHRSATPGGPYTKVAGPLAASAHTDTGLANGTPLYYVVRAVNAAGESPDSPEAAATPAPPAPRFRRGNVNSDQRINLTDAVNILGALFLGDAASVTCRDAADTDDDGKINITDAVNNLGYQFLGSGQPAAPGPHCCGADPTPDVGDDLGCLGQDPCPPPPPEVICP